MKILITGTAGFIGHHLVEKLVRANHEIVGIDNLNTYYDVQLKLNRLNEQGIKSSNIENGKSIESTKYSNYKFIQLDLANSADLNHLFEQEKFDVVCNLAAQAGVRYSIDNPKVYMDSNVTGFFNITECSRIYNIKHLVYASSSSVYGNSNKSPFSETDVVDQPISLYAASKKSNELIAYTYSHLFKLRTTGLRFFTVYGPWGRPDMAYFMFTENILKDRPIKVYANGQLQRDFTFIDDIVQGVERVIETNVNVKPGLEYKIYNIGNNHPVSVNEFIATIEDVLQKKAVKEQLPLQPGDVNLTYADISKLETDYGFKPRVSLKEGITKFVDWYQRYYLTTGN